MFDPFLIPWCNIRSSAWLIPLIWTWKMKTWNMDPTRKAASLTKNKLCMTRSPSKRQDTNGFSNSVGMKQSQLEMQHPESCRRHALEGEEVVWVTKNIPNATRTDKHTWMHGCTYTHTHNIPVICSFCTLRPGSQELNGAKRLCNHSVRVTEELNND